MRYLILLILIHGMGSCSAYAAQKCYLTTYLDQQGNPVVMPVSGWHPKNVVAEVPKHEGRCPGGDVIEAQEIDDPNCEPEGIVETVQDFVGMEVCPKITKYVYSEVKAEAKRLKAEADAKAEADKKAAKEAEKASLLSKCEQKLDPDVCAYLFREVQ